METFQAGAVGPLDLQMSIPGNPYVSFANLLRPLALSEGRLPSQLLGVHFGWAIFVPAAPDGITSYPSGGAFQLEKPLWISQDLPSSPGTIEPLGSGRFYGSI